MRQQVLQITDRKDDRLIQIQRMAQTRVVRRMGVPPQKNGVISRTVRAVPNATVSEEIGKGIKRGGRPRGSKNGNPNVILQLTVASLEGVTPKCIPKMIHFVTTVMEGKNVTNKHSIDEVASGNYLHGEYDSGESIDVSGAFLPEGLRTARDDRTKL